MLFERLPCGRFTVHSRPGLDTASAMSSTARHSARLIQRRYRAILPGSCAWLAAWLLGCGSSTTSPAESSLAGDGAVATAGTTMLGLGGSAGSAVNPTGGVSGAPAAASAGASAGGPSIAGAPAGFDSASYDITVLDNVFCETKRKCCAPLTIQNADVLVVCAPSAGAFEPILKGTLVADRRAIQACTAAYQAAAQTCSAVEIRKACRGFVAATQAIGEPCSMRDAAEGQCKSDMGPVACVPTDQSGAAGVCAAFSHGRAGDSCDASCKANGCEFWFVATRAPVGCFESDGLACSDANTDSKKCQPISKRGQPCFLGTCGAGDVCGTSAPTTSNTTLCMAPALLGEYCGGGCAEGLACIGLTCQPDTLGADSRSCDNRINE